MSDAATVAIIAAIPLVTAQVFTYLAARKAVKRAEVVAVEAKQGLAEQNTALEEIHTSVNGNTERMEKRLSEAWERIAALEAAALKRGDA